MLNRKEYDMAGILMCIELCIIAIVGVVYFEWRDRRKIE
jgi:hypothetical protein